MKENWKKKAIIAGAVIIVICIAVFVFMSGRDSSAKKIAELLDLGNKYLTEQDYEQAVVTYKEIIEIDPKCEEAYRRLADAYVAMDDYESAMDILQQGIAQTGSEELAAYLEEIKEAYALMQEETALEKEETEAGEYSLPYYELGFSPEDFTIAGYSVMDGDHVDDILQAAAEILPYHPDVRSDYEYDGWSYYDEDSSEVGLIYYAPNGYSFHLLCYHLDKDGVCITLLGTWEVKYPADDPVNEFPLYEGPIVPNVTSYEEILDILGIRQLILALEATETDENGVKSLDFESQYGAGICLKSEEVYENKCIDIYDISSYSRESGTNWYLRIEVWDSVLSEIFIRNW